MALVALVAQADAALVVDLNTQPNGGYWDYARSTTESFDPNNAPVVVSGSVNPSGITSNGALLVGLVDKQAVDNGNSDFFDGAYAYFGNRGGQLTVGPSDGNAGGEFVQNFVNVAYPYGSGELVHFTMTLFDGVIDLSFEYPGGTSYGPITDTYGDVKDDTTTWDEFQFGAYLGADLWSTQNGTAQVDATGESQAGVIPEPGSAAVWAGIALAGLGFVLWRRRRPQVA
jgi:LPXTG-motif cell wall-anchored protein